MATTICSYHTVIPIYLQMVRIKHRYITAQLLSNAVSQSTNTRFGATDINNALKVFPIRCFNLAIDKAFVSLQEKVGMMFGDVGSGGAAALTKVCYYDPDSCIMIIRVSRDFYRKLILSLSCVTHIKGLAIMIRCLNVSSTARTCVKGMKVILSNGPSVGNISAELDTIKSIL